MQSAVDHLGLLQRKHWPWMRLAVEVCVWPPIGRNDVIVDTFVIIAMREACTLAKKSEDM
jgi:hypothetical protein